MSNRAGWWFAWYPVKTVDTKRITWLKKVYREQWPSHTRYYTTANPF